MIFLNREKNCRLGIESYGKFGHGKNRVIIRNHSYRVAVMGQKVSLIGVEGHVPREALTVPILLVRKAVDIV